MWQPGVEVEEGGRGGGRGNGKGLGWARGEMVVAKEIAASKQGREGGAGGSKQKKKRNP